MLTESNILARVVFEQQRDQWLKRVREEKLKRRILIGPNASLLFESDLLVWWQIQETLRIEPSAQAQEELSVYNRLIPSRQKLTASLMLEYEDPNERQKALIALNGIEKSVYFCCGDTVVPSVSLFQDQIEDKAYSVNFIAWTLDEAAISCLKRGASTSVTIDHPFYHFQTILSDELQTALYHDCVGSIPNFISYFS